MLWVCKRAAVQAKDDEGSSYRLFVFYGDNQSVLCNTCIPDSTLKKKNHAIAYHFVQEGVAREEWVTGYVKNENNAADLQTKITPAGERHDWLVVHYLYEMWTTRSEY